ncbi:MAG: hypothetical protein FJ398_22915 [Verrucomicrobia bacterium]|nr:hypothetical protein [Verrucomicrobiota bacterium]
MKMPLLRSFCGDLERGVIIAMDDFAEADFAAEHFGELKRVEGQQQPVGFGELVAEDETDGHELSGLAPACGRNAFGGVKAGFHCGIEETGLVGQRLRQSLGQSLPFGTSRN